jgi:hypothetical protein
MNDLDLVSPAPVRQILSLSGGKDSTALAIYMRDRVPDMEYVFCDTAKELPETYEYLDRVEVYLGKPIVRLKNDPEIFDTLLKIRGGFLPSPRMRWCTEQLKIRVFERYVGNEPVMNYIGIRADEDRQGNISGKENLKSRYPFIEDGIRKEDVACILEESGLGVPDYYKWRSRSGCYFCFYQQRIEWVGLLENHPQLFEEAMRYEKEDAEAGTRYTWVARESLKELSQPDRIAQIKEEHMKRMERDKSKQANRSLVDVLDEDYEDGERACLICEL